MIAALSSSPSAATLWAPTVTAVSFFLGTFILEDVAAVGAGLAIAAGGISWPAAFAACFLGIWMGDAALYAVARRFGRPWFERSRFRHLSGKVAESELRFARRGAPILIFSRMIPGARLPTYLAAGFLRLPVFRFLLVTGVASCVWTCVVLFFTQHFGEYVAVWLRRFHYVGWAMIVAAVFLAGGVYAARQVPTNSRFRRWSARYERWGHWEFWPAWLFYAPVGFYYCWLALKHGGAGVPTCANPGIFSGGIVGESKNSMLEELSAAFPEFAAPAALLAGDTLADRLRSLEEIRARLNLGFPFVLKPDVGQRGVGVKIIRSDGQAEAYLRQTEAPLVAQRYAPGPCEAGVFYYRFPGEDRGRIFAITEKIFPELTGDGRRTVAELIYDDPRARLIADKYLGRFEGRVNEVLAPGERLRLVEAGNHAQGCIFRDGMRFCTPALEQRMDEISRKISGFFIGRYDIRYANEDDLRAGINFQIIELNGAASEATSIYDAKNSLFAAYRTLFRQWDLVFAIGAANRRLGCAPTKLRLVWQKWREHARIAATYPAAD